MNFETPKARLQVLDSDTASAPKRTSKPWHNVEVCCRYLVCPGQNSLLSQQPRRGKNVAGANVQWQGAR
jgi:hypothetical protein